MIAPEVEWLEAARQAFLWRFYFDDCSRSREAGGDLVLHDFRRDRAEPGVLNFGTTTSGDNRAGLQYSNISQGAR